MTKQLFLILLASVLLPPVFAKAEGDDLAALWASLEQLARTQCDEDTARLDLGFLTPLLETIFDDFDPAATTDELEPPAPDLAFDLWVAEYAEDCGPKEESGSRFVLEYSFDF